MTELQTRRRAVAALRQMRRGLRGWLKYRRRMDDYVRGEVEAPLLFRRAKPLPPAAVAATLRRDRLAEETDLAETLHALLVETGCDASALPRPDVAADPDAAVKLAEVAIRGVCPEEVSSAQAQGIAWFVLAIPLGAAVLVLSQVISSKADVAMEKERLRCVQSGACTDAGFWLKWGAILVGGWVAWDKLGLREVVRKKTA